MSLCRAIAVIALLAALGGCSSSFGSGGGSAPARTYVVLPNGQTVPADRVPGGE